MSASVIVATPDELRAIVRDAVREELAARPPSPPATESEWIDTKAAAAILGVSRRHVGKMAASAKDRPPRLLSKRMGKLLRFRRADVMALLEGPP